MRPDEQAADAVVRPHAAPEPEPAPEPIGDREVAPPVEPIVDPPAEPGHEPPLAPSDDPGSVPGVEAGVEARVEPGVERGVEPPPPEARLPTVDVVDVHDLDWAAVRRAAEPGAVRSRMRSAVERLEALLDREGGPALLFDADRSSPNDRAIRVGALDPEMPMWFVGDLHGDLLALEAALAHVDRIDSAGHGPRSRIVFLGDLFDDGAYGLEVLLRVFELVIETPDSVCVIAGNHDEALTFDGARFASSVSPSDFSDYLDAHLAHEWIVRAGKLAVRLFENAPRALFLPDELLVAHGGIPLTDLHPALRETGDWNDPRCLTDFVWTRAHPRARRKMPNRTSRGSQFGHEDFAAFCALSGELGRPVSRMVRGHDHVEERYEVFPAYAAHPMLTTVALSRRLPREMFGPYVRVPTIARWVPGELPQVHRLHLPAESIVELYPDEEAAGQRAEAGGA